MSTTDTFVNRVQKERFYLRVGARIREAREAAGMTRQRVADAARVTYATIENAEDEGAVSLLVAARIAEALDCLLDELVPVDAEVEE